MEGKTSKDYVMKVKAEMANENSKKRKSQKKNLKNKKMFILPSISHRYFSFHLYTELSSPSKRLYHYSMNIQHFIHKIR